MNGILLRRINLAIFVLVVFTKSLSYVFEGIKLDVPKIYLVLLILLLACSGYQWYIENRGILSSKSIFFTGLSSMLFMILVYFLYTLYYIIKNDGTLSMQAVGNFFELVFPAVCIYFMVNIYENEELIKLLRVSLVVSFVVYFVYRVIILGPKVNTSIEGILSFSDSFAPYEDTPFSTWSIAFFLIFNKYKDKKFYLILSSIFVFMTFKRFLVLSMVFGFIFSKWLNTERPMGKRVRYLLLLGMYFVMAVWLLLILGYFNDIFYDIFGINFANFTMSRLTFFSWVMNRGFVSNGLYSSKDFISQFGAWSIEMDLPMIYLELGLSAVLITVFCIWKLIRNRIYEAFIVVIIFVQLLTSAWLEYPFFWIFIFILFGMIEREERGDRSIGLAGKNTKRGLIR